MSLIDHCFDKSAVQRGQINGLSKRSILKLIPNLAKEVTYEVGKN